VVGANVGLAKGFDELRLVPTKCHLKEVVAISLSEFLDVLSKIKFRTKSINFPWRE